MSKISTLELGGKSNQEYSFNVYEYDTDFKELGAVYAMTHRYKNDGGGYTHNILYIGRTEDISERFDNHDKEDCFERNDANCVCIHSESSKKSRTQKESDLLKKWNTNCNE